MNSTVRSNPTRSARLLASTALAAVLAIAAAGCNTTRSTEPASTSAMAAVPPNDADARSMTQTWGERHRANPNDVTAAINYAQGLRASGQRAQAAAIRSQASGEWSLRRRSGAIAIAAFRSRRIAVSTAAPRTAADCAAVSSPTSRVSGRR